MSRVLGIILVGLLILPSGILVGSVALHGGKTPGDCQHRETWLRDSTTRFAAAEGAAGSVDRYSGTSVKLSSVANAYAKAAAAQLASSPPGSDTESNSLIAQYFQWMTENWTGWVNQRYYSTHTDAELLLQAKQIQAALTSSESHCA